MDRFEAAVGLAIFSTLAALIGVAIYIEIKEEKEWQQFKVAHKCRVVAKISGDTFNTLSMDSKGNPVVGIATTPDKTGWACDDGITYYR
jgi:hypothetical protein